MASGYVDFPTYMKTVHEDWLHQTSDVVTSSLVDLINGAISATPYNGETSFDPDTRLSDMDDTVTALNTMVTGIDADGDYTDAITTMETAVDGVIDDTFVAAEVTAYTDIINSSLEDVLIPTFSAGMRDIGAVMSSAFAVGISNITAYALRDIAKFEAEIQQKLHRAKIDFIFKGADRIVQTGLARVELKKAVTHYRIEANRLGIAAQKEETDQQLAIEIGDAKFKFDAFQYGANVMAAISGGTAYPNTDANAPSTTQSAIGGALAGAALGSQMTGSWQGGAVGGLIGLGLSLL